MTRKNNTKQAMPKVITGEELKLAPKNAIPALKNAKFQKHVDAIVKARNGEEQGRWTIAKHISDIMESECYKDDFNTLDEVATYLCMKKSNFSMCKNAIEYRNAHPEVKELGYTVRRAYLMSTFKDAEERLAFLNFCTENGLPLSSDKAVSNAKSAFKKDVKGLPWKEEEVAKARKEKAEREEGTAEELTKEGKDIYIKIFWRDGVYEIPAKALKAYRVDNKEN